MTASLAIGVDVGATKIAAILADRSGHVLAEERALTGAAEGVAAVVSRIAAAVRALQRGAPAPIAGVGVGIPGYVDAAQGIVRNAVNLGWQEVDLAARLRDEVRLDVWAGNDANVLALGEYYYGSAQGCANFAYIAIGSGLGSGIVLDGRLVTGATYAAAELGHLSLDPAGRLCACGLRGCVETVVSGPGILATAREHLARGEPSTLRDATGLTPENVLDAALARDPLAVAVFDETAAWLGMVFAVCAVMLNPERIVIGGGLGRAAFDLLVPGALAELSRRVVPQSCTRLQVIPSQVTAGAVGASSLVWQAKRG